MSAPLLSLEGVSKRFVRKLDLAERTANLFGAAYRTQVVRAVNEVSLSVNAGDVVGIVGESGCGKSTLGRIIAGLLPPSDGRMHWQGEPTDRLRGQARRDWSLAVQMVFQDPYASLNPRLTVAEIVGEAPVVHGLIARRERDSYVADMLQRVGLDGAMRERYPHQFSGGQRQRIGIARALAVQPTLLVCDEAIAALDVSVQAQVLNLFMKLRDELGLTYLFISHDLGVVEHIADRIAVMYLGRVVEIGTTEAIFAEPRHPYTEALLAEIPKLDGGRRRFQALEGEVPSPLAPPSGCHFHPRCRYAGDLCGEEAPALLGSEGREVACHLYGLGAERHAIS